MPDIDTRGKFVITFTGHRPNKIGGYDLDNPLARKVKDAMVSTVRFYLDTCLETPDKPNLDPLIISGGALGVDSMAMDIAIKEDIPYVLAAPFLTQDEAWPLESKQKYAYYKQNAQEVVIVSPGGYSAASMQVRNIWMADRANVIIAIWDGSQSGTGNCVRYARQIGRHVHTINPQLI